MIHQIRGEYPDNLIEKYFVIDVPNRNDKAVKLGDIIEFSDGTRGIVVRQATKEEYVNWFFEAYNRQLNWQDAKFYWEISID